MPRTQSAKKALRQSLRRRAHNIRRKEAYKKEVKNLRRLVSAGKKSEAAELLPALYQAIDKAAKTHAIQKNTASRLKSRLTKLTREKKA